FGQFGPAVVVGAYASREALQKHFLLDPHSPIAPHQLMFFSSAGPTYMGVLRPNIVAPGSSISSMPSAEGLSVMMQGTSMASPLAAGAAASILSLAKTTPAYDRWDALRTRKIQAIRKGDWVSGSRYSLISIPLALRTAMEESAEAMDGYTVVQRGHGLLRVPAAYDELIRLFQDLTKNETELF